MATKAEVVTRLNYHPDDEEFAVAIWVTDDVMERAKELKIKLTKAQAKEIIKRIDDKQDCSLGISWDVIDCYIYDYEKVNR